MEIDTEERRVHRDIEGMKGLKEHRNITDRGVTLLN